MDSWWFNTLAFGPIGLFNILSIVRLDTTYRHTDALIPFSLAYASFGILGGCTLEAPGLLAGVTTASITLYLYDLSVRNCDLSDLQDSCALSTYILCYYSGAFMLIVFIPTCVEFIYRRLPERKTVVRLPRCGITYV